MKEAGGNDPLAQQVLALGKSIGALKAATVRCGKYDETWAQALELFHEAFDDLEAIADGRTDTVAPTEESADVPPPTESRRELYGLQPLPLPLPTALAPTRTRKSPKQPSKLALKCYRLHILREMSQTEIAKMLTEEHGQRICQATVSRHIGAVVAFIERGNVLPPLNPDNAGARLTKMISTDPAKLDYLDTPDGRSRPRTSPLQHPTG